MKESYVIITISGARQGTLVYTDTWKGWVRGLDPIFIFEQAQERCIQSSSWKGYHFAQFVVLFYTVLRERTITEIPVADTAKISNEN